MSLKLSGTVSDPKSVKIHPRKIAVEILGFQHVLALPAIALMLKPKNFNCDFARVNFNRFWI